FEMRAEGLNGGTELLRERLHPLPGAVDDRRLFSFDVGVRSDGDDAHEALLSARDHVAVRARFARGEDARSVELAERGELRRDDDASVRGPIARIAGEHAREQLVERGRHFLPKVADTWRRFEEHLGENRDLVIAGERGQAGEALEEDGAEREDVGARVELLRP